MMEGATTRSGLGTARIFAFGLCVIAGCAHLQPPPVPRVPHFGYGGGLGGAGCAPYIARAHAALAAAGTAAGDPAATAAAHAANAAAMASYHACLAQSDRP